MGYEYLCLNNLIKYESIIKILMTTYFHKKNFNFSPIAGYPISYFIGWAGFIIMLLTNFYIIRKRFHIWQGIGKTAGWFDFHIFCGILGPILIIFHSNFKVDGLVSISFWSMIICSSSGIIGRYFYIQTLKKKEEINRNTNSIKLKFEEKYASKFSKEEIEKVFTDTINLAGARSDISNPIQIFVASIIGDFNLAYRAPGRNLGIMKQDMHQLKKYGIEKRRILFIDPFTRLLGYWHSFHLPFAIFMYLVAVIHIVAALLFGVKH